MSDYVLASSSSQICCKCHAPSDSTVICLTGTGSSCADMLANSSNPAVVNYICDKNLQAAECRSIGSGGQCPTTQDVLSISQGYLPPPSTVPPLIEPELNVRIPGLTFSSVPSTKNGSVVIPFLAQYISALYNYLLGFTLVTAAVMIVYGGFRYILGSTAGTIQEGKEIIHNSIIGLVLMFGSFTILKVFSPEAASLKPLEVHVVKRDILADFLLENGTTYLDAPMPTAEKVIDRQPGTSAPAANGQESTGGQQAASQQQPAANGQESTAPAPNPADQPVDSTPPAPTADVPQSEIVDVSNISYDSNLSATENIFKYCTSRAEASNATTYNEKIKLLVKSVLGFYKVCVDKSRCVYTQAGMTSLPSGKIGKTVPLPSFAVRFLMNHGLGSLDEIFSNNPECVKAWTRQDEYAGPKGGPGVVDTMSQCVAAVRDLYNAKVVPKIEDAKVFASDCISFDMAVLDCAGPKFEMPRNRFGTAIVALAKGKEPTQFLALPQVIAFTKMADPKLQDKINEKGGMKFGDLIAVFSTDGSGGGLHWYMYTGGRPEVPFTFIEMSGGPNGANIPGLGHIGGVNIKFGTLAEDLAAKMAPRTGTIWGCKPADAPKCQFKGKPAYNPATAGVLIWRPYAEAAQATSSTSP
jgi:hypothetical protein